MLTGQYRNDKVYFYPDERSYQMKDFFIQALLEGEDKYSPESNKTIISEQELAIEYDLASWITSTYNTKYEDYAIVLGKVGLWKESAAAFKKIKGDKHAGTFGNQGVVQHALENYKKSVEFFETALKMNPIYFQSRPIQKKIWEASKQGHFVNP